MDQLSLFERTLPPRAYCTDAFDRGVYLRPKIEALQSRYVQANGPRRKYWLVFDVDRPGGGHDWQLRDCPSPNIVVENRENLHAHLFYGLGLPVHTDPEAHLKPLRYAAAIESALCAKLEADFGYAGFLAKNPLSKYWDVRTYQDNLYDLGWLSDYVDLAAFDARRAPAEYGLGRNCLLFDRTRRWAYSAIRRQSWPSFELWRLAVLEYAVSRNDFDNLLPMGEVKATSKSVAKWVWHHFSPASFSAWQTAVNRKRWGDHVARRRQLLLDFLAEHPDASYRTIEAEIGIPIGTAHRIRKGCSTPISDF